MSQRSGTLGFSLFQEYSSQTASNDNNGEKADEEIAVVLHADPFWLDVQIVRRHKIIGCLTGNGPSTSPLMCSL